MKNNFQRFLVTVDCKIKTQLQFSDERYLMVELSFYI